MMNPDWISMMDCMFIKIAPVDIPETIKYMESVCKRLNPAYPLRYMFFDERRESLYRNEQRTGRIVGWFTFLAIAISCLGLFGRASFMAAQRTKEIGIRRVLGAPVSRIILLLSADFTKWVLAANIIAWPVAYFAISKWLENFAYRTNVDISVFVISGVLALVTALLTVSYQTLRTALANPVDSLRYE